MTASIIESEEILNNIDKHLPKSMRSIYRVLKTNNRLISGEATIEDITKLYSTGEMIKPYSSLLIGVYACFRREEYELAEYVL